MLAQTKMNKRVAAFAGAKPVSRPVINIVSDELTEVFIYESIGGSFWDGNPTEDIVKEIAAITTPEIRVRLNSPGGVVWDGVAIYNSLVNHDAKVTVQVDGLAASIASVIAMAGDEIVMNIGSQMMIHKPMMLAIGNSEDLTQAIVMLEEFEDRIVEVYQTTTDMSEKNIRAAMAAETWYGPDAAVEAGFATKVGGAKAVENNHDLTAIFDNVPDELRPERTVRDVERTLRDGGFSRKQATKIAAIAAKNDGGLGDPDPVSQGELDSDELAKAQRTLESFTESLRCRK